MKNRPFLCLAVLAVLAAWTVVPVESQAKVSQVTRGGLTVQGCGGTTGGQPTSPQNPQSSCDPDVTSLPMTVTVNCSQGDSVGDAVAYKPNTTALLTITINGICTESVDDVPGGILLQAGTSGGGLTAPSSSTDPVLGISGIGVTLNNLTISGGIYALRGRSGAAFTGTNLVISGASTANVLMNHAAATLNNVTIQNSANDGIDANYSSSVYLNGGVVQGNANIGANISYGANLEIYGGAVLQNNGVVGAEAVDGAAIYMTAGTVQNNGLASNGNGGLEAGTGGHVRISGSTSVVVSNYFGLSAYRGGTVFVDAGAVVANNANAGIYVYGGGIADVRGGSVIQGNAASGISVESGDITVGDGNGPAIIQNNGQNGIFMRNNSVASFNNSGNQIINNVQWGIFCTGAPSNPLIFGTVGTVSGNGLGQIACNTSPSAPAWKSQQSFGPLVRTPPEPAGN